MVLFLIALGHPEYPEFLDEVFPYVPALPVYSSLTDKTPVDITIREAWESIPAVVTRDALLRDQTLWLKMHFGDWDKLAPDLWQAALSRMLERYGDIIDVPQEWWAMTAHDWDRVPQPIRAMAFMRMIDFWTSHYQAGAVFGLDTTLVADVSKAIAMAESWFEHRAVHTNEKSTDLGLSQASDYARAALERLHRRGRADFVLSDEDYLDPLQGSRKLVFWFDLMLEEADGDMDLAIRAYNTGIGPARRGAGDAYLQYVLSLLETYIRNRRRSPTWRYLLEQLDQRRDAPPRPPVARLAPHDEGASGGP